MSMRKWSNGNSLCYREYKLEIPFWKTDWHYLLKLNTVYQQPADSKLGSDHIRILYNSGHKLM